MVFKSRLAKILLVALVLAVLPFTSSFAAPYGCGAYGAGSYGDGSCDTTTTTADTDEKDTTEEGTSEDLPIVEPGLEREESGEGFNFALWAKWLFLIFLIIMLFFWLWRRRRDDEDETPAY